MKTVTLMCRGESLKSIDLLPKADYCVLVNAFHFELEDENIHNYVKGCSDVNHVVSAGAHTAIMKNSGIYKKYNFKNIVLPYVKGSGGIHTVIPPMDFQNIEGPDDILPVIYLSDNNKADMMQTNRYKYTSPSSGMDALLYIVNDLQADVINIIGLDFYDNVGYFTNSYGIERDENNVESVMDRMKGSDHDTIPMKSFFYNFVKNKPDVKFVIYTLSHMEEEFDNLVIKNV